MQAVMGCVRWLGGCAGSVRATRPHTVWVRPSAWPRKRCIAGQEMQCASQISQDVAPVWLNVTRRSEHIVGALRRRRSACARAIVAEVHCRVACAAGLDVALAHRTVRPWLVRLEADANAPSTAPCALVEAGARRRVDERRLFIGAQHKVAKRVLILGARAVARNLEVGLPLLHARRVATLMTVLHQRRSARRVEERSPVR